MEWFPGSIVDAIMTAKSTEAYFVVYVEGTDDASKITTEVLDKAQVSGLLNGKRFICIKLLENSEGHKQFAEIYKMVPIPSVFFIAHTGIATDVVLGGTETAEVEKKILEAVQRSASSFKTEGTPPPQPSQVQMNQSAASALREPSSAANSSTSSSDLIKAESSGASSKPKNESQNNASPSLDEKVEKAKQLITQKNEEKRKEDIEKEKATERERRRIGQEMHKAKMSRQEQEMKEALEERKKNVNDDAAARKKILDQIAQDRSDRLERQRMFSPTATTTTAEPTVAATPPLPPTTADSSRIQIRLPSGETKTHVFPADTTLMQIREFIDNNVVLPFSEYSIATTFPRREFTWRDNELNLRSLQLLPSGVLLVLPVSGNVISRPNGWAKAMVSLFWSVVTPFFALGNYISSFIFGGGARGDGPSQPRPTEPSQPRPSSTSSPPQFGRTTIRKRGNIHSLSDGNDNKDDNNTWNGNSTQQM